MWIKRVNRNPAVMRSRLQSSAQKGCVQWPRVAMSVCNLTARVGDRKVLGFAGSHSILIREAQGERDPASETKVEDF